VNRLESQPDDLRLLLRIYLLVHRLQDGLLVIQLLSQLVIDPTMRSYDVIDIEQVWLSQECICISYICFMIMLYDL